MAEQLGVERAHDQTAAGQPGPVLAQPRERARDEVSRVLARLGERTSVVVRSAVVAPRCVVVDGVVVVVAVDAVGGISIVAPHEIDRLAVDRDEHDAGIAEQRSQVLARARTEASGELDARGVHPRVGEQRLQPPGMSALGQPEAPAPAGAEASAMRVDPALHLQA